MASEALNSSVVKTELDMVFYQEWDKETTPGYGNIETEALFRQQSSDKAVEQRSVFIGTGYFEETNENQNIPAANSLIRDKVNYTMVKFSKGEEISKEFFDDDQHDDIDKIVRSLASRGRATQNLKGFSVYRNAFDPAFPGGDGQPLCSDAHPTNTSPESNKITDKLSPDSLNEAVVKLQTQRDKDGTLMGARPTVLLVSPFNFKRACEIVDSELLADTANNNINVYSSKYGLMVYQNPFLGQDEGGPLNPDAWFLLSDYHSVCRIVREPISTNLIDWRESRNQQYFYSSFYRESVGFNAWMGLVGSDGTTGSYN